MDIITDTVKEKINIDSIRRNIRGERKGKLDKRALNQAVFSAIKKFPELQNLNRFLLDKIVKKIVDSLID